MIAFSCQKCGKHYCLKPEFAGRKTTCSACREPMEAPFSDSPETIGATHEGEDCVLVRRSAV